MAILKCIEVEVVVDGNPLLEYEDHDEENTKPNTLVKYIEVTTGSQFRLHFSASQSFKITSDAVSFKIFLDGHHVENFLWLKERLLPRNPACQATITGASWENDQGWQEKPFIFSNINYVEDSIAQHTMPGSLSNVGTITVKVYRKTILGKSTQTLYKLSGITELEKKREIAESKLKGMGVSHNVELGKEQKRSRMSTYDVDYTDGRDFPVAVFEFKYRSKRALQAMLLIPRSPTPLPVEERPVEELNVEELRELARKQRARPSSERKVKSEPQSGVKRERDAEYKELLASATTKKVKRAHSSADVEVIDLCGDD